MPDQRNQLEILNVHDNGRCFTDKTLDCCGGKAGAKSGFVRKLLSKFAYTVNFLFRGAFALAIQPQRTNNYLWTIFSHQKNVSTSPQIDEGETESHVNNSTMETDNDDDTTLHTHARTYTLTHEREEITITLIFSLSKVFAAQPSTHTHTRAHTLRRNEEDRKFIVLQSLRSVLDRHIRLKCPMARGIFRQEFDIQARTHATAKQAD